MRNATSIAFSVLLLGAAMPAERAPSSPVE